MSFLAWDIKAPRGFGRLRGYTAPLPGLPPGSYAGSTAATVERAMSATVASVAPMVVQRTVTAPATRTADKAKALAPRYVSTVRTPDDMVAQIGRAGENVADQSMGATDATRAAPSGNSADDAAGMPPGTVVDDSGTQPLVMPSQEMVRGPIPWWVYFAGGAVGGGLLAALLSR